MRTTTVKTTKPKWAQELDELERRGEASGPAAPVGDDDGRALAESLFTRGPLQRDLELIEEFAAEYADHAARRRQRLDTGGEGDGPGVPPAPPAGERRNPDRGPAAAPAKAAGNGWLPMSFLTGGPTYYKDLELMADVAAGYDSHQVRGWHRLERSGQRVLAAGPGRRFASGIGWHLPELIFAVFFAVGGVMVWWPLLIAAALAVLDVVVQERWRGRSNRKVLAEAERRAAALAQAKRQRAFAPVDGAEPGGDGEPVSAAPGEGAAP